MFIFPTQNSLWLHTTYNPYFIGEANTTNESNERDAIPNDIAQPKSRSILKGIRQEGNTPIANMNTSNTWNPVSSDSECSSSVFL